MSNNSNNSNNNFLGLSIAQGQVFRKQQQTRILTNNDVVTGNIARDKNKNKVSKQKNCKETMANIEPFSQKNAVNGNSNSDNYAPVSKMEIARDEGRIKITNEKEKAKTKDIVSDYSQSSKNLNKFQQGVTNEAKAYNNINKNPSLLNQNYITEDNQTIRVNNAGVINTLSGLGLKENPRLMQGINIASSVANPPDGVNYIQIEDIPTGLTSGPDTGLYSQQTSATPVSMPQGISGYKLEGENVYVVYPYPNSVATINKNMSYLGVFNPVVVTGTGLSQDSVIGINTTLKCVQHAIDKGFNVCGMTNYSDAYGGSGSSVVGNIASLNNPTQVNYAYKVIPVSTANAGLNFPQGHSSLTFGADGVLYAGYKGNSLFLSPLTSIFNGKLDPLYGGTINNIVASYAYNQGYWNNLPSFPTNSDYTGQSSGTYNTLYQYNIEIPNLGFYTETYNTRWGESTAEIPYIYYTTQTETQLAAPNVEGGNLTYINYNCGNNPAPNTPINVGGQNAGAGYNVSCAELYSQYPSFTLTLSDTGVLTISNNANSASNVTYSISFDYQQQATLSNGTPPVKLNMPRSDWVNDNINCINSGGGQLTSSSMNTPSMGNGQWISSTTGLCRLILNNNMLQLEYSLQNATQDADGNLVGNGSSVALYSIQNVNNSNLGSSAHIDINGAVNPYPQDMIEYDSSYTEMKGYIPNPAILNQSNIIQNANDEQCKTECNKDSACAGYVVYGNCNLLTAGQIFPTGGDRIPASQYSTYIRNPVFPQNDNSCRKTLDAVIDSDAYSYYLSNGITPNPITNMTPKTKCNLGKVLDKQMNILRERNQQAINKGNDVKNQFQDLFERENNVLNSISDNRIVAQIYDKYTKKATDKIKDIENAQITKSAAEKDSELLLISDNYRYVILGIVSLLLSIAAIKGMRVASS
jgi:hypothetical protein